jgi:uncharacterized protein (TIGR02466 family)
MEIEKIFPVELFVFRNTSIDNDAIIKQLQSLDNVEIKKGNNLSMLYDLRNDPKFADLFSWFHSCLEQVRVEMKYDCDKIEISNSWFNVALSGYNMYQNFHRHSMSFYSAVYYLTEGTPTIFDDPVEQRNRPQLEVLRHDYFPDHMSTAEPGKLVIFPSWLYHGTKTHIGTNDRYIISFNTLPTGKVNHKLATDSRTEISIK